MGWNNQKLKFLLRRDYVFHILVFVCVFFVGFFCLTVTFPDIAGIITATVYQ